MSHLIAPEDEEGEGEDDVGEDDIDGLASPDAPLVPGEKPRKKRRKKKKKLGTRKIRANLSTKPQDFQVRIKYLASGFFLMR